MVTRGQIHRAVFWQEMTGHVVDAHARFSMPHSPLQVAEDYVVIDGAERAVTRFSTLEYPLLRECDISHLRQMQGQLWPVSGLVIGFDRHDVFAIGERLDMTDARRGPANMAGAMARLQSHVFEGPIFQSHNILEGFPWACTSSTAVPSAPGGSGSGALASGSGSVDQWALFRVGQTGWVGSFWDPGSSGVSVDYAGALTLGAAASVSLSIILPIQGATLSLEGVWLGTVSFLDWSGAALTGTITKSETTVDASGQVPDKTWTVLFTVTEAEEQPIVKITSPGPLIDPRPGIYVGDNGVQVGVPIWSS